MAFVSKLVLLFFTVCLTSSIWSQKSVLDEEITLDVVSASVIDFLIVLESKADVNFTYSSSFINLQKIVSVKRKTQSLKQHLDNILSGQNVMFREISENRILLTKGNKR